MLICHTVLYLLASTVSAIFGLMSAIVFTRLLSPAEYGVYVVGVTTAGILSALLFTWVRLSVLRYQSDGELVDLRKTAFVAYLLSVCAAPVGLVAATVFSGVPASRMIATLMFTIGLGLFELGQEILKARQKSASFAYASMLRSVIAFLLCLAAASLGGGGLGQLAMGAAAYFVSSCAFAFFVWEGPVAKFDAARLQQFLRFGVPITVSGLVFALHGALDRLMIAYMLGETAAGQYGASADLVRQIILIPATSIACASVPMAVRALAGGGERAARDHLELSAELLAAIVFPSVVGLALTARYVADLILGPDFRATAIEIMPILAFAWLAQSFSQSYVHSSFHLAQKPNLLIVHGAATLVVNVVGLSLLLPLHGLRGAAISLVISEGFGFLFGFALTRFAHPLPHGLARLARVGAATAVMVGAIRLIEPHLGANELLRLVTVVGVGVAAYALAALAANVANSRDRLLVRLTKVAAVLESPR